MSTEVVNVNSCNISNNVHDINFPNKVCVSEKNDSFINPTNPSFINPTNPCNKVHNSSVYNNKTSHIESSLQSSLETCSVPEFDQNDQGQNWQHSRSSADKNPTNLPNEKYFADQQWEIYSEQTIKTSFPLPVGDKLSKEEYVLLSNSTLKGKPEKYRFPKEDPPTIEGLKVFTPKEIYLYLLNLIYHRLTPEIYEIWCHLTERYMAFPEMSKQGILETNYSLKNQREKYKNICTEMIT